MPLHTILASNTLTNKGVQTLPIRKSEPLLSSSNVLALQTDTFVKQPQATTLQSQPISEPRMGELSLPKDLTPFLIPAVVLPVCFGILYLCGSFSVNANRIIQKELITESLEEYDAGKKSKSNLTEGIISKTRNGNADSSSIGLAKWFTDNVAPALLSEAITSGVKLPFEYFEKLEAKELEKQINERDRKFQ
jgi:hypothetical protein